MKALLNTLSGGYCTPHSPAARLTDRELEILQLVGEGRDSHTIARLLGLDVESVEADRRNIQVIFNLGGTALVQHRAR
jgi:DNA-binding CsgD family transcriptional regulator